VLVVCVYPAAASTYYVGGSTTMDIYAQTISTSQRRALQQLTAFVGGGGLPAVQQTGMNLDFSSSDAAQEARSNSVQLGGFFRCSERLEKSASH
jgi:hypothetical protein